MMAWQKSRGYWGGGLNSEADKKPGKKRWFGSTGDNGRAWVWAGWEEVSRDNPSLQIWVPGWQCHSQRPEAGRKALSFTHRV